MARVARLLAWGGLGALGIWACGAGIVTVLVSTPSRDFDGFAISWENRAFWISVGVVTFALGLVLLLLAVVRFARTLRSSASTVGSA